MHTPAKGMDELNPQQREAVLAEAGHVLVLAGAGSGKTRVLTERIAHLVRERGISPERVLAFTFTNKAAGEMRARVERRLAMRELPLWIGTFHATGLRILRREAKHIGVGTDFAVYDDDDQRSLVRDLLKKKGWSLDENPPGAFRDRISRWKSRLVPPAEALSSATGPDEERQAEIYRLYEGELRRCNALDFDDLIGRVVELFTGYPKVRERYARQFQHVLVDEFQDTNAIQMLMIDALASHHGNLFVVGDDDQAIYGWRGATVENILQFDRVYAGTAVIRLEENYRSTNAILEAANALIRHNRGRKGKELWSRRGAGEPPLLTFVDDEIAEAEAVRAVITRLIREGWRRSEIAVLYRTHAQSRALENALRTGGMPYQIIGGVRYYERREVRDILGYLKLVSNPADDVNFRRIVNVPRRGIGDVTLERIERAAAGESLLRAARRPEVLTVIPPAQRSALETFSSLIASFAALARTKSAHDVLSAVIERTGYRTYLAEDPRTALARLENVEELLVETARFSATAAEPTLAAFLEEIALVSDIDALKGEETVALMTLHNAKGLEYRAVIITGVEEGLLPHYASAESAEELEEERRLFYVGITRAMERLFLFSAANRMRFGSWLGNIPSRFIGEIPERLLAATEAREGPAVAPEILRLAAPRRRERSSGRETAARRDRSLDPDAPAPSTGRFRKGAHVIHPSYGEGIIVKVEGSGQELKVTVTFPGEGEKKFLAAYAPFRFV